MSSDADALSDPELESGVVSLSTGIPPPEHPPRQGPERENWSGWEQWEQHCRVVQQHTRLLQLQDYIIPTKDYYYSLDEEHLGSIKLPDLDFPEYPDLRNYAYDEVQEFLEECYQQTFEVAVPRHHDSRHDEKRTRQTTLGRYLMLYQPLPISKSTSKIRLLEVLPAAHESDKLIANLFTADLDSISLEYEALSYTWDSICINQADVEERCHQVVLMARIYAGASRVIVYLGASTPSSDALFRLLQSPILEPSVREDDHDHGHDHDHEHEHDDGRDDHDDHDDDDDAHEADRPDPEFLKWCHDAGPDLVDGFIDVSSRSWWTRIWVLQEYTLNKRDPVLYCGRSHVQNLTFHRNFGKLYKWVEHRKRHPTIFDSCTEPACDKAYISDSSNIDALEAEEERKSVKSSDPKSIDPKSRRNILPPQGSIGREWTTWGHKAWKADSVMSRRLHCSPYSLPHYLILALQAQCTDPHDAVYGLRELMDPLFRSLFPPDYMIPIPTLFSRLAVYMIVVDMNADIFWYFPYRCRDRDWGEMNALSHDTPSWVPDFTRPRLNRNGEDRPVARKEKPKDFLSAAHIFDRILFMNGLLLDEIIDVYPLPASDPFLLLQQLWFVERTHWQPEYMQDKEDKERQKDSEVRPENIKDRFTDMVNRLGGITGYPSITWATESPSCFSADISIVELLDALMDATGLVIESFENAIAKVPEIVDIIMEQERHHTASNEHPNEEEQSPEGLTQSVEKMHLTHEWIHEASEMSRRGRILDMEDRLLGFLRETIDAGRWKDLVGIFAFDYDNFRSQIVHRLAIMSAQRIGDIFGDNPKYEFLKEGLGPRQNTMKCAVSHAPIYYHEYIDLIENGYHPLEIRLREGFLIECATKIHNIMADMIGLDGDRLFQPIGSESIYQKEEDMESSRGRVCMFPLLGSGENKHNIHEVRNSEEQQGIVTLEHLSTLKLPHVEEGYPFGSLLRWHTPQRKQKYDVHNVLQNVIDFLAGRELFITQTGLEGITGVGTTGVQDGDDLFLLEGMSYPLIARLEPNAALGEPKKRRREMPTRGMKREILGTAVVRDLDPKEGNLDEATKPSWFEDISEGSRGRFRFS
ncbi:hypothetical protein N0V90_010961 [Kalmusia sp. IMI 367209]|nr:hypothetical protein N0V90_010961 [Kalmusia sp. IMI 367209]